MVKPPTYSPKSLDYFLLTKKDRPRYKKSEDSITMAKGEEHQNTEKPMSTQELLNTMVVSKIQLREDTNLMVQQF